ncbi:MAG: Lrp/AsnC family transcriptional regulator [Gemmatimonadota bacterium]|nr:Lrp/AsnC family transcriptional regulator [Gemmatimonadota bacterium]
MTPLDNLDNRIMARVQSDFPVCERPFRELARQLDVSEAVVLERVRLLRECGVIRRFGAVFDSRKLGYSSTLAAVCIPDEDDLPRVAGAVNRYPEVTHNYQRQGCRFNLWFTVIAESGQRIEEILSQVAALEGVAGVKNLPAEALYKVNASFKPLEGSGGEG